METRTFHAVLPLLVGLAIVATAGSVARAEPDKVDGAITLSDGQTVTGKVSLTKGKSIFIHVISLKKNFHLTLDQIDSVIGALLALAILVPLPGPVVIGAIALGPVIHVAFNLVFVVVGLKERAL